jgi:hypothetical protein
MPNGKSADTVRIVRITQSFVDRVVVGHVWWEEDLAEFSFWVEYEPATGLPDYTMPKTLRELVEFCLRWIVFLQSDAVKEFPGLCEMTHTITYGLLKKFDKAADEIALRDGLPRCKEARVVGAPLVVVVEQLFLWREWALDAIHKQTIRRGEAFGPAGESKVDPELSDLDTIWWHGEKSYSTGGKTPLSVSQDMHQILHLFCDKLRSLTTPQIEEAMGWDEGDKPENAVAIMMNKIAKMFGPNTMRRPGRENRGKGYFISVRKAENQLDIR